MIFPTLDFLLFFLVVWVVSWGLLAAGRHQLHKIAIVAASYFFYACWSWRLTFLLAFNVLLNWSVGRFIGSTDNAALAQARRHDRRRRQSRGARLLQVLRLVCR